MADAILAKSQLAAGPKELALGAGLDGNNESAGLRVKRWRYTGTTSDATPLALTADRTNEALTPSSAYAFHGTVVGYKPSTGDAIMAFISGGIKQGAAAANTAMVGAATVTIVENQAGTDVAVSADTTNGRLAVTVTGLAASTFNWTAEFEFIKQQ